MRVISLAAAAVTLLTALPTTAAAQPPPAGAPTTIAVAIQRAYATVKTNFTQAAEKMSEADYAFKPSTMAEVRTYGQLFAHVAQSAVRHLLRREGGSESHDGPSARNRVEDQGRVRRNPR